MTSPLTKPWVPTMEGQSKRQTVVKTSVTLSVTEHMHSNMESMS